MPVKKYIVALTEEERKILHEIINKDKHSVQKLKRAQALLLAEDSNYTDDMIAEKTCMSHCGLAQLRQRFVEEGFEATLGRKRKPGSGRSKKLGRADEARLIALVCSCKPDGKMRWSLRLLRDTWSTLPHTDAKMLSHETIRRTLKKMNLSLEWERASSL